MRWANKTRDKGKWTRCKRPRQNIRDWDKMNKMRQERWAGMRENERNGNETSGNERDLEQNRLLTLSTIGRYHHLIVRHVEKVSRTAQKMLNSLCAGPGLVPSLCSLLTMLSAHWATAMTCVTQCHKNLRVTCPGSGFWSGQEFKTLTLTCGMLYSGGWHQMSSLELTGTPIGPHSGRPKRTIWVDMLMTDSKCGPALQNVVPKRSKAPGIRSLICDVLWFVRLES